MEIVAARAGGPELEPVLQDYRRRYHLSETVVLNALLEALTARHAHALLALDAGRPVGAAILSQRGEEAQLRLLHALDGAPDAAPVLLARVDELLRPGETRRITGSLPLGPQDPLLAALRGQGYAVTPRARLVLEWAAARPAAPPPGYELQPWQDRFQDAAVTLLERAHRESADSALHPEWAGREGTARLLQAVYAGRFGRFDPAQSATAWAAGALAGLSLNVWHAALPDQGFILDLAVAPAHRRQGLARALVAAAAAAFQEAGAHRLGLAVTLDNRPAVALYAGLGFQVDQYFSVVAKEYRL